MTFAKYNFVLCHLDIASRNIIVLENDSICLLDWESAGFFPRFFEICTQHIVFWREERFSGQILKRMEISEEEDVQTKIMLRRYGNYQHWALYLQTDNHNLIFEVTGNHPNFKRNELKADPKNSQSFIGMICMDIISSSDITTLQSVARTTKIDNETVEWDCQEYVLDMLETLEKECVVDADDETYKDSKKELKKKRGAI